MRNYHFIDTNFDCACRSKLLSRGRSIFLARADHFLLLHRFRPLRCSRCVRRDFHRFQDLHVIAQVSHFRYRYLDPLLRHRSTSLTPTYEALSMHSSSFNSPLSLVIVLVDVSPFITIYRPYFTITIKLKRFIFLSAKRLKPIDIRVLFQRSIYHHVYV